MLVPRQQILMLPEVALGQVLVSVPIDPVVGEMLKRKKHLYTRERQ
jgi:hypothetical protein